MERKTTIYDLYISAQWCLMRRIAHLISTMPQAPQSLAPSPQYKSSNGRPLEPADKAKSNNILPNRTMCFNRFSPLLFLHYIFDLSPHLAIAAFEHARAISCPSTHQSRLKCIFQRICILRRSLSWLVRRVLAKQFR